MSHFVNASCLKSSLLMPLPWFLVLRWGPYRRYGSHGSLSWNNNNNFHISTFFSKDIFNSNLEISTSVKSTVRRRKKLELVLLTWYLPSACVSCISWANSGWGLAEGSADLLLPCLSSSLWMNFILNFLFISMSSQVCWLAVIFLCV